MISEQQNKVITTNANKVVVIASAAAGKAQPNDTIIPTPLGYRRIGDLAPGDEVFNRFGKAEKVLQVFPQGEKQVYEVELADGRITECCEEHLWSYDDCNGGLTTKTLKKMFDTGWYDTDSGGRKTYKYRIPVLREPVYYPEQEYDTDPYKLGFSLGKNCCAENKCTGESCRCSREKTIPQNYLIGSYEQRIRLLQGLMDNGGDVGDGICPPQYFTNNLNLAESVLELVRSLGFYGRARADHPQTAKYCVDIFTGNERAFEIVSLPQKVKKALTFRDKKQESAYNFVSIVDIRKTGRRKDMTCILVDHPEHLYLTNNFIVTHNTTCLVERVKHLLKKGISPSKIVVITFTNSAAEEIADRLGHPGGLYIGTVHGYANRLLLAAGVETDSYLAEDDFDALFSLIKQTPGCIKEVDHLLLDEAQDSDPQQIDFLLDRVRPKNYMLVGDHRQALYAWRGASPDLLIELTKEEGVTTYEMTENYRNGSEILENARSIIRTCGKDYQDKSIPMRGERGEVEVVEYDPVRIARGLKADGNYGDWFVLTRTNAQLEEISLFLKKEKIPVDTFKRAELDNKELNRRMKANTVKVLTVHGCIPGDTLVQTSNGIKPIKEIVEQSDYSELVYDGEKYAKVKIFVDNGKEKVYKITTEYGNTIEVTKNHEVCILTENGIEKRKALELKGNEELLLCKNVPNTTHKVALEKVHCVGPEYLTEDLAELVGLITAGASKHCDEGHGRISELIYKIFGEHFDLHDDGDICEYNSKLVLDFLKLNFDGIAPNNGFISSKILEGDKDIYRAFLRGLLVTDTAEQRPGRTHLIIKSTKMKEQLQTMLFNLGIDCAFKNLVDSQVCLFGDEAEHKKENKSKSLCQLVLHSKDELHFKENQLLSLLKDGIITERAMEELASNNAEVFREDTGLGAARRIFSRYQVEQIESIVLSEEEVDTYCLEMEDKHEFIQNGFLMGNSKGLEAKNVIAIGTRFYNIEERCVSYVAATRARDRLIWARVSPRKKGFQVNNWEEGKVYDKKKKYF